MAKLKDSQHDDAPAAAPQLLAAKEPFSVRFEGADHSFTKGEVVEAGHAILRGVEHLFEPVQAKPCYRVQPDDEAPAEPASGEKTEV